MTDAIAAVAAVVAEPWVIDGNFLDHAGPDGRSARANTLVLLDLPPAVCIFRVLFRLARERWRRRPDLPIGARETFDPSGLAWIAIYRRRERPRVLALLEVLGEDVDVRRVRSARDVDACLGAR